MAQQPDVKKLHGMFSPIDFSEINGETLSQTKAKLENYFRSKNFDPQSYHDLMTGRFHDNFNGSDLDNAAEMLKQHPHNTPAQNDKIIDTMMKDIKAAKGDDYWERDRLEHGMKRLPISAEKLQDVIDNYENVGREAISDLQENPAFNREHLASIVNKPTIPVSNDMMKHPAMDKELFDKLLAKKKYNYEKLPTVYESPHFTSEHAKKILENSKEISEPSMNGILSKMTPEARHSYLNEALGITGGKPKHDKDEVDNPDDHGWDNWSHGEGYKPSQALAAAASKYLSPDQIDFIKRHGDFKEKFKLFENEDIDPKHHVEMLSKWDSDDSEHGYDRDEMEQALKNEKEGDKWEDFHEEGREAAEEENPWDSFISNYDDNELSNAYFDVPYDEWKAQWAGKNKPTTAPNPDFDPSLPVDDTNPKELDYSAEMENHPDFDSWDDDAQAAFKQEMAQHDTPEQLYEGYDEYIRDDEDRAIDNLFDHEVENWSSSEYMLPKHVVKAVKAPWENADLTPEQMKEGLNSPMKMVQEAVADNENLPSDLITHILSDYGPDGHRYSDEVKKNALGNKKNLKPEHIDQVLSGKDSDLARKVLSNPRVTPEQISKAIDNFDGDDTVIPVALDHPNATDADARKVLQSARTGEGGKLNPHWAGVKEAMDSRFHLTPEELKEGMESGDDEIASKAVKHANATPELIQAGLTHKSPRVQKAAEHVQTRRFPPTSDSINLKLNTHPLRQLRDFIDQQGGTTTKAKMKALGANTTPIDKLFNSRGQISSGDVQKYIDAMPATQYNTSHGRWHGGQEHTDKEQDVFQLNYTQDQVNRMEQAGVLPTFQKIHEASFKSGHPVRPNSLGWVRYTGDPDTGFHIDEIQTDFGQSMIKRVAAQAKEALRSGAISDEQAENAVKRAKEYYPEEDVAKITDILFGKKHPSEVLHEGFKEYMRQKGFGNTPVHIWTPESKAPLSMQSTEAQIDPARAKELLSQAKQGQLGTDAKALISWGQKSKVIPASHKELKPEHMDLLSDAYSKHAEAHAAANPADPIPKIPVPLPVHMQEGYGAIPKKMKYTEGKYGEIPTQENPGLQGASTYKDLIRKSEVDASTKKKIAITLKAIKDNSKIWDQLKQSNPQAYQALTNMVQSLVELFKKKTGEDPQALVHQLEIQQQLEEQQQQQGNGGQPQQEGQPSQPGQPAQDTPLHRKQMNYAPGSERTYSPQDKRIKDQEGNWNAFKGGLQDPDGGQSGG